MENQLLDYERQHLEQLRALAPECTLFLKRSGKLPLPGPCEIALYGSGARHTVKGGTGSGNVNNLKTISLLEGLENSPTLRPDGLLARKYRTWCLSHENLCVEGFMMPKGYYNEEMSLSA